MEIPTAVITAVFQFMNALENARHMDTADCQTAGHLDFPNLRLSGISTGLKMWETSKCRTSIRPCGLPRDELKKKWLEI